MNWSGWQTTTVETPEDLASMLNKFTEWEDEVAVVEVLSWHDKFVIVSYGKGEPEKVDIL